MQIAIKSGNNCVVSEQVLGGRGGCKFVGVPSVPAVRPVGMRNVALLKRERLTALLTGSLAIPDPLNHDGSIRMLNFVRRHDIEMFVGAEKPYISGRHYAALTSPA